MPKTKIYYFLLIFLLSYLSLLGQDKSNRLPIELVLDDISTLHNIVFNYKSGLLKDITVLPIPSDLDLSAKIENLENQTNLVFNTVSNAIITISKPVKICGTITDEYLKQPLEGATINSASAYAISDENGYFEMMLKSQDDELSIRFIGFKTMVLTGKDFNLETCNTITLQEQEEQISTVLLQTYLIKGIDKKKDWTTSIDYNEFSLLPGLIESDVLQTVQALPSVLSVDETVSNINIRAGSNDQNLILWDDIKMYQTGHFFGLISSFNPQMTSTASVINNGTDVSYTDGVSGTINMHTKKRISDKFDAIFGVNFLNAELFTDIPLGEKSSVQVAARKSLDDLVRTPTYDAYFDRVAQNTEAQTNDDIEVSNSNKTFNFYDTSLRWLYKPTKKDFFRVNFIFISNDLKFDETSNVERLTRTRQSNVSQNSMAFGLNYKRQWNDRFSSILSIYNSDYELKGLNADVLDEQLFLQKNSVSETSIKFENIYTKNLWQYKLGYNFIETEVINLNDIDVPRFVRRDEEVLRTHAAFGQVWYNSDNKDFSMRGGIRANYLTKFETFIVEPRLSIRQTLGNHLQIEALGEFKHQNTSQIVNFQNDFLGVEKRRWLLTNDDNIPIIRSKQASFGMMFKKKGWLLDGKAYYKEVDGITTQSQSFTTKYEFEREKGSYDAFGFECLLRKKFNALNSWLSYSYINSTYTFETLEEVDFSSNFDISHSVTFGSTYSNKSFNISGGINYRIGKPTSVPLEGAEIIDDEVNFDIVNNNRLQDYLRIDASAIYKFKLSNKMRSEIGVSVWNISNRENVINNYFRVNESLTVDKFSRFSLGLTTNAVFRVYF